MWEVSEMKEVLVLIFRWEQNYRQKNLSQEAESPWPNCRRHNVTSLFKKGDNYLHSDLFSPGWLGMIENVKMWSLSLKNMYWSRKNTEIQEIIKRENLGRVCNWMLRYRLGCKWYRIQKRRWSLWTNDTEHFKGKNTLKIQTFHEENKSYFQVAWCFFFFQFLSVTEKRRDTRN